MNSVKSALKIETLQAEIAALRQENNRQKQEIDLLKNIITLIPAYIYWVDTDGRYLGCNDLYAQSVGLASRQDIIGKTHQALPWNPYPHLEPDALDAIHQQIMQTGETLTVEEPASMPDGTQKTFLSTTSPLKNTEGEIIGRVVTLIDITERKGLERALSESLETARIANPTREIYYIY